MKRLLQLYKACFAEEPSRVEPIIGSASNRQYYRLSGSGVTCIGVVGTDVRENKAFLALAEHFRSKGIDVPQILSCSEDSMVYLQEDLGGQDLFNMYVEAKKTGAGMSEAEDMLCRTMAALTKLQFEGADGLDFKICYPCNAFDRRRVMFDLNYFKYCFLKPSGQEFDEAALQDDFERFADDLLEVDAGFSAHMNTFLYRDFNSRNVMIKDNTPYFIDFQGGMRGPIYYDVASFVWHARSGYPEQLKERMLSSYMDALRQYIDVDEAVFREHLRKFVLFRILQVLGAYGFRGLVEHKAKFITSIPAAIDSLKEILQRPFDAYTYLMDLLQKLTDIPKFHHNETNSGVLEVRVCSFSFHKGIPQDMSGNGGGYVFDCRSIHNPGRYEPYKKLTGKDEPVIRFLEDDGEVFNFLEHVYAIVDPHVETYSSRGFTSLMVSFGCTGGQHRSVYCAEHLAHHLAAKFPNVRIRLTHREQTAYPTQLLNA
jgi:aminoglycoside/choline kinase family phosphotransferase